ADRPWGLWRYRELLPVADLERRVDLGEGGTPLIPLRRLAPAGIEVLVKEESFNPTGSFKARGMAMAVTRARELGVEGVELASAGNAAVAACAHAAAGALSPVPTPPAPGLRPRGALPPHTPAGIPARCRAFGAEVLLVGSTLVESR